MVHRCVENSAVGLRPDVSCLGQVQVAALDCSDIPRPRLAKLEHAARVGGSALEIGIIPHLHELVLGLLRLGGRL